MDKISHWTRKTRPPTAAKGSAISASGVKQMPPYGGNCWKVAMFTQPFHDFHDPNAFLSEGGALAVVVESLPETPPRG